jgi:hypothetical protein
MENNTKNSYIKTDDDKIINERCIRWVKKIEECLQICCKSDGCTGVNDTHQVCKINNPNDYSRLNKHFIPLKN